MVVGAKRQRILIVDDVPENITIIGEILTGLYDVCVATNGEEALQVAQSEPLPDLILLDVIMPGLDGYEVCKLLKSSVITRQIPVIFVTTKRDIKDEEKGFEVGAVDYILKPVSPSIVRARVRTHLALYDQNRELEKRVEERTHELGLTQDVTIHSLAVLAETRDYETGGHIMRTQRYVRILAEYLMPLPEFRDHLDKETIELLIKSVPLHDIGKVGIPDIILLKPGKLSIDEFELMKKHTVYGRDAILRSEQSLIADSNPSFLRIAREIAYTHHEKWNGLGYPRGLAGKDIPISGRLMAIADVYDALISKRVYKPPFSHTKAISIMKEERGILFDPIILDAFLNLEDEFRKIAKAFASSEEERLML